MENVSVSKYTISFGLSLAVSCVIDALLVIAKETNHAVLAGMQQITGHQWITHSTIVLILFALLGSLFARANGGQGLKMSIDRLTGLIVAGVVTACLIIIGFYLIAD